MFDDLSVRDNLTLMRPDRRVEAFEPLFRRFPVLGRRLSQHAGTLSGGEKKMLSFARGVAEAQPLLLLDEPSEGVQWENILQMAALVDEAQRRRACARRGRAEPGVRRAHRRSLPRHRPGTRRAGRARAARSAASGCSRTSTSSPARRRPMLARSTSCSPPEGVLVFFFFPWAVLGGALACALSAFAGSGGVSGFGGAGFFEGRSDAWALLRSRRDASDRVAEEPEVERLRRDLDRFLAGHFTGTGLVDDRHDPTAHRIEVHIQRAVALLGLADVDLGVSLRVSNLEREIVGDRLLVTLGWRAF